MRVSASSLSWVVPPPSGATVTLGSWGGARLLCSPPCPSKGVRGVTPALPCPVPPPPPVGLNVPHTPAALPCTPPPLGHQGLHPSHTCCPALYAPPLPPRATRASASLLKLRGDRTRRGNGEGSLAKVGD